MTPRKKKSPPMMWEGIIGFVPDSDKGIAAMGEMVFDNLIFENMKFRDLED